MFIKYSRLIAAAADMPWAIMPGKLEQIAAFLQFAGNGGKYSAEERAAAITPQAAATKTQPSGGSIAVIPVYGVISQRMDLFSEFSGGTSTEGLAKAIRANLADPAVAGILLDFDSPGGGVYGVPEVALEIFNARGQKPIFAQVNSLCASAAYWIAAACDEIAITPSGEAGSVGVYAMHFDESKADEMMGLKVTIIRSEAYKAEGNPYEPLSEDAQGYIQKRVDDYDGMFVNAVSKYRSVPAAKIRAEFGKGRALGANDAKAVGMVDRIATFDDTIRRLSKSAKAGARADEVAPDRRAEERELSVMQLLNNATA